MPLTIKEIENAKPKAKKYKMLDGGIVNLGRTLVRLGVEDR